MVDQQLLQLPSFLNRNIKKALKHGDFQKVLIETESTEMIHMAFSVCKRSVTLLTKIIIHSSKNSRNFQK